MGAKGSAFIIVKYYVEQPVFKIKTVNTTGAGDAFMGGILYSILKSGKCFSDLTVQDINAYMEFANAAGSLVTTKKAPFFQCRLFRRLMSF